MKGLLIIALTALLQSQSIAATWTFHFWKDNYGFVDVMGGNSTKEVFVEWDFGDAGYDGGVYVWESPDWSLPKETLGFFGDYSFSLDDETFWGSVTINGPAPSFNGGGSPLVLYIGGGEFWIDFSSDGAPRISETQPADFGKWAWDGSINPSWVAAKKGYAKGHNKQPLPSPK